jgi:UDP-glucose:(heptosyl)LPS alpha-1,3-glucosyltransferase
VHWLRIDPFHLGRVWREWSFARAVRRAILGRFDLVQSHERIPGLPIYRAGDGLHRSYLAQRRRVAGPLERLGFLLGPFHRYSLAAEARMYRHPGLRAVICNSEMVRREIREAFGVDPARLYLIRNAVDGQRFCPPSPAQRAQERAALGVPEGVSLLAFVGSGFARKGLGGAFAALARARAGTPDRDLRLVVIGGDRRIADYRREAMALGVAEAVIWAGELLDVRPWLRAADGFVLPSLYDPFPNAVLEALACGLPVAVSVSTGTAELLSGNPGAFGQISQISQISHLAGVAVDALDSVGFAAAIDTILDPPLHPQRRLAARQLAEQMPPERMADELVALYRGLLGIPG